MCLGMPLKQSAAFAIGFIKGKSLVRIHGQILGDKRLRRLDFFEPGALHKHSGIGQRNDE